MPDAAFRYLWRRPVGGFALYWSPPWTAWAASQRLRPAAGSTLISGDIRPEIVLAPRDLPEPRFRVIDLNTPKARAELVREIELLDPTDLQALAAHASKWGMLIKPGRYDLRDLRARSGLIKIEPCDPSDGPLVMAPRALCEPLERSQVALQSYQEAVRRYADLRRIFFGDARKNEEAELHALLVDKLGFHGGSERDSETYLPLIPSPIAAAWQHLAELRADAIAPVRCEREGCPRAFTRTETEKRMDMPLQFCSPGCRLKAWRNERSAQGGKSRARSKKGGRSPASLKKRR